MSRGRMHGFSDQNRMYMTGQRVCMKCLQAQSVEHAAGRKCIFQSSGGRQAFWKKELIEDVTPLPVESAEHLGRNQDGLPLSNDQEPKSPRADSGRHYALFN